MQGLFKKQADDADESDFHRFVKSKYLIIRKIKSVMICFIRVICVLKYFLDSLLHSLYHYPSRLASAVARKKQRHALAENDPSDADMPFIESLLPNLYLYFVTH